MRHILLIIATLALTILCWGTYGPLLHWGQAGMMPDGGGLARLKPFVCVGLAYFLIGVIVPGLWLYIRGEKGDWTVSGIIWSLIGGALGAIGALGLIFAFKFGGRPIYVMPLVFGGAPVVNSFLTIFLAGRRKEIGPLFLAALIIVIIGAVTVLLSAPHRPSGEGADTSILDYVLQLLSIAITIVSWGAYGPALHKGQVAMHHSRMRPFLCVGLAYFLIAVLVPNVFLMAAPEASSYATWGTVWSLAAGAAGAIGALGIILSFNFGGSPIYIMPLVFGGAPVVNTLFSITAAGRLGEMGPLFLAGLILVIAGSAMVLVLARKMVAVPSHAVPEKPQPAEPPKQQAPPESTSKPVPTPAPSPAPDPHPTNPTESEPPPNDES